MKHETLKKIEEWAKDQVVGIDDLYSQPDFDLLKFGAKFGYKMAVRDAEMVCRKVTREHDVNPSTPDAELEEWLSEKCFRGVRALLGEKGAGR